MAHDHEHTEHYHTDEKGVLVKCYHQCKALLAMPSFWIGSTISFPLEHFIWEKLPGFSHLAHWMGM